MTKDASQKASPGQKAEGNEESDVKEAERKEPTGDASAAATEGRKVEEENEETKQTLKQDAEVKDEKSGKKTKQTNFQLEKFHFLSLNVYC